MKANDGDESALSVNHGFIRPPPVSRPLPHPSYHHHPPMPPAAPPYSDHHPPAAGGDVPPAGAGPSFPPPRLRVSVDPLPTDVLLGRGGHANAHPGNRAFRTLVERYRVKYQTSHSTHKMAVAATVVALVRRWDPPGRFLRRDGGGSGIGPWCEVGDGEAKRKASHALREGAPVARGQDAGAGDDDGDEEEGGRNDDPETTDVATGASSHEEAAKVGSFEEEKGQDEGEGGGRCANDKAAARASAPESETTQLQSEEEEDVECLAPSRNAASRGVGTVAGVPRHHSGHRPRPSFSQNPGPRQYVVEALSVGTRHLRPGPGPAAARRAATAPNQPYPPSGAMETPAVRSAVRILSVGYRKLAIPRQRASTAPSHPYSPDAPVGWFGMNGEIEDMLEEMRRQEDWERWQRESFGRQQQQPPVYRCQLQRGPQGPQGPSYWSSLASGDGVTAASAAYQHQDQRQGQARPQSDHAREGSQHMHSHHQHQMRDVLHHTSLQVHGQHWAHHAAPPPPLYNRSANRRPDSGRTRSFAAGTSISIGGPIGPGHLVGAAAAEAPVPEHRFAPPASAVASGPDAAVAGSTPSPDGRRAAHLGSAERAERPRSGKFDKDARNGDAAVASNAAVRSTDTDGGEVAGDEPVSAKDRAAAKDGASGNDPGGAFVDDALVATVHHASSSAAGDSTSADAGGGTRQHSSPVDEKDAMWFSFVEDDGTLVEICPPDDDAGSTIANREEAAAITTENATPAEDASSPVAGPRESARPRSPLAGKGMQPSCFDGDGIICNGPAIHDGATVTTVTSVTDNRIVENGNMDMSEGPQGRLERRRLEAQTQHRSPSLESAEPAVNDLSCSETGVTETPLVNASGEAIASSNELISVEKGSINACEGSHASEEHAHPLGKDTTELQDQHKCPHSESVQLEQHGRGCSEPEVTGVPRVTIDDEVAAANDDPIFVEEGSVDMLKGHQAHERNEQTLPAQDVPESQDQSRCLDWKSSEQDCSDAENESGRRELDAIETNGMNESTKVRALSREVTVTHTPSSKQNSCPPVATEDGVSDGEDPRLSTASSTMNGQTLTMFSFPCTQSSRTHTLTCAKFVNTAAEDATTFTSLADGLKAQRVVHGELKKRGSGDGSQASASNGNAITPSKKKRRAAARPPPQTTQPLFNSDCFDESDSGRDASFDDPDGTGSAPRQERRSDFLPTKAAGAGALKSLQPNTAPEMGDDQTCKGVGSNKKALKSSLSDEQQGTLGGIGSALFSIVGPSTEAGFGKLSSAIPHEYARHEFLNGVDVEWGVPRRRQNVTLQGYKHDRTGEARDGGNKKRKYCHVPWEDRLNQLVTYKAVHGSTSVPRIYPDQSFKNWVNNQRAQYSRKRKGMNSHLTDDQQAQLEDIGFSWSSARTD